jgi:flagellar FliL protein
MPEEKDMKEREEKVSDGKEREGRPKVTREEPPPKKKKTKLILVLVLLILLLAGGGAGAYFFLGDLILEHYIASRPLAKKAAAVETKKGSSGGPILTLDPFIFNLAGNSSRFAKVSLAVSLQNAKAFEEAKKIVPVLRDKALMVLSGKSAEELTDVSKRDSIKVDLQKGLKEAFKEKEDLESVYITDIIIP